MRDADQISVFWNDWWKTHASTFRPLSHTAGEAVLAKYLKAQYDAVK